MPFVALSALLGILAGLGCCLLTAHLPQPWPALATTSATWGALVWLLLRAAAVATPRPGRRRTTWCLAGAASMTTLLVASDAWLSPLSLAAALVAGALVGWVAERTAAGQAVWLGVLGGLMAGEGGYGVLRRIAPQQHSVHYLTELVAGLLLCLAAGRPRRSRSVALRSLALGILVTVVIAGGCLAYDEVRAAFFST